MIIFKPNFKKTINVFAKKIMDATQIAILSAYRLDISCLLTDKYSKIG